MVKTDKQKSELLNIFCKISNDTKLMDDFLTDILTPSEYVEIVRRWQIVSMLDSGVPQRKIAKDLNVGIATVTRGSTELRDKNGGFAKVLKLLSGGWR